ncbi:MAG: signal recognition particle-docking protein FtsY [Thiotrichales bacterium]
MFGFKKTPPTAPQSPAEGQEKKGLFARLRAGLAKTGHTLTDGMSEVLLGRKAIDDELFEELETRLLVADVGMDATQRIIDDITQRVRRKELTEPGALYRTLGEVMQERLAHCEHPLQIDLSRKPFVILVVGINGAGKTTTIGKLAHQLRAEGLSVMLAAGDTFRAAAVEQLQVWGERNHIPVIAQGTGADSASVIFDALQAAQSRGIDVLIADTAGRLHTQDHLMEELKKVKRVLTKRDPSAPHETLLVIDGGIGQNALRQTEAFHAAIHLTGLAVTKLDGTAKGGILFAIAEKHKIPIRLIGVGEGIEDLRTFRSAEFVQALLGLEQDPA